MKQALPAALVSLVLAAAGCSQRGEPVTLRVAPPPGRIYRYETKIQVSQEGLAVKLQGDATAEWSLTSIESSEPDVTVFELRVARAGVAWGGVPARGSASGSRDATMEVPPRKLEDGSIRLRFDSRGRLRAVDGLESIIDDATGLVPSNPGGVDLAAAFGRGAVLGLVQQAASLVARGLGFVPLSGEAVSPGTKWSDTGKVVIPSVGHLDFDLQLEFLGSRMATDGPSHRIQEDLLLRGEFNSPSAGNQAALRVEDGFVFGDVEIDSAGVPIGCDLKGKLPLSVRLRSSAESESPDASAIAITLQWRVVTTRLASN